MRGGIQWSQAEILAQSIVQELKHQVFFEPFWILECQVF
jgi:hypothetical protein